MAHRRSTSSRTRTLSLAVAAALPVGAILVGCSSSKTSAGDQSSASTPAGTSVSKPSAAPPAGSDTASAPAPAQGDGCQYVNAAEVSSAVGVTVSAKPTPPRPPFNAPGCLYASSGVPVRQITVRVLTAEQIATVPGQTAQSYFNAAKSGLTNVAPISGFGDEAFTAGSAGAVIQARKGTTIVAVTAGVGGVSAQAVNATRTVMTIVLSHV